MQISVEEKNGVSIFRVNGDIDINSSPDVKKSFDEAIRNKKDKIVINLSEVNYVDSSGLATLVEILKNIRPFGGKMKITNLSSKVKGLFEITKLDKLFDLSDEENDAVNSF
ncbi:MAG: anti-sigma factor antagonist [Candidatus Omnitrophica bacterium]|nr:anti-sigma factor antagonist [Candidatus Omnitrophota bacterium]